MTKEIRYPSGVFYPYYTTDCGRSASCNKRSMYIFSLRRQVMNRVAMAMRWSYNAIVSLWTSRTMRNSRAKHERCFDGMNGLNTGTFVTPSRGRDLHDPRSPLRLPLRLQQPVSPAVWRFPGPDEGRLWECTLSPTGDDAYDADLLRHYKSIERSPQVRPVLLTEMNRAIILGWVFNIVERSDISAFFRAASLLDRCMEVDVELEPRHWYHVAGLCAYLGTSYEDVEIDYYVVAEHARTTPSIFNEWLWKILGWLNYTVSDPTLYYFLVFAMHEYGSTKMTCETSCLVLFHATVGVFCAEFSRLKPSLQAASAVFMSLGACTLGYTEEELIPPAMLLKDFVEGDDLESSRGVRPLDRVRLFFSDSKYGV